MELFMGIGGAFFIYFGILLIVRKKNCKTEVQGTFVDSVGIKVRYSAKYSSKYSPIFRYVYEGVQYKNQSFEAFSRQRIKKFIPGEKYTIYVHDKKPKYFVIDRKLRFVEFLIVGIGLLASLRWIIGIIEA